MPKKKSEPFVVDLERIRPGDRILVEVLKTRGRNTLYIGVDPGASGGIAFHTVEETRVIRMLSESVSCRVIHNAITSFSKARVVMYIEKVFAKSGQRAMQEYLTRAGTLMGAAYASHPNTHIYEVEPKVWQNYYQFDSRAKVSSPVKGMDARDKKAQVAARRADLKEVSRNLYAYLRPEDAELMKKKSNDGMSDAFFILLYGMSMESDKL